MWWCVVRVRTRTSYLRFCCLSSRHNAHPVSFRSSARSSRSSADFNSTLHSSVRADGCEHCSGVVNTRLMGWEVAGAQGRLEAHRQLQQRR